MSFIPRPHEIYKHFKGNLYQITAVAEHTETGEQLVVYQAMYGDFKTYARPLSMFVSKVDREKYPDAAQEYRFELQGENRERQKEREREDEKAVKDAGAEDMTVKATGAEGMAGKAANAEETAINGAGAGGMTVKTAGAEGTAIKDAGAEGVTVQAANSDGMAVAGQEAAETLEEAEQELNLDPMVLEFLDADSYEKRLNILAGVHHRITDDMINTMAVACDVEVPEGELEQRYISLKNCLLMLEKYECNRLRE